MPGDYYSEDAGGEDASGKIGEMPNPDGEAGESMDEAKGEGEEKGEESGEETTLMPKSMLAGKEFNVGDEVVMKIVRMDGDEIEVAYATGDEKKEKGEGMDDTESRMSKYADKE